MKNLLALNRKNLIAMFGDGFAQAVVEAVNENPDPKGAFTPIAPITQKWLDGGELTDLEVAVTLNRYNEYLRAEVVDELEELESISTLMSVMGGPAVAGPTRNN